MNIASRPRKDGAPGSFVYATRRDEAEASEDGIGRLVGALAAERKMTTTFTTAADEAELELLLDELLVRWEQHRGECSERPCPHLREAVGELLAWRRRRFLVTRAAALRAQQDLADWTAAPGNPAATEDA